MERFFSYSQFLEDLIAYNAFSKANIEGGVYVDVGANDPIQWSVTKALYEHGWSGMNVEPIRSKYEKLCKDRVNDVNLNLGCADEESVLTLYECNDLSTFDKTQLNELEQMGIKTKRIEVEVKRLTDILDKYAPRFNTIHFLKIDVEGFEYKVLKGIDFSKYKPWLICIEKNNSIQWEDIIIGNGYSFILEDTINRWYCSNEHDELIKNVIPASELKLSYEVFQVIKQDELEKSVRGDRKTNGTILRRIIKSKQILLDSGISGLWKAIIIHFRKKRQ